MYVLDSSARDPLEGFDRTPAAWEGRTQSWNNVLCKAEIYLKESLGLTAVFDEVAMAFWDQDQEYAFIESAVRNGYTLFNAADDTVNTAPIRSQYDVHYSFLQAPGLPWRIEAMRITDGCSPLHTALYWNAHKDVPQRAPFVVHASWKCADEQEYQNTAARLCESPWLDLSQRCQSTYGTFSYWLPVGEAFNEIGARVYLKPRVNMRDAL